MSRRRARPAGFEPALRAALFCTLGLLLLTPWVLSPDTVDPFTLGKAPWSRSLIEIAFVLCAVLALTHRGYRPPRSWLLVLLGTALAVSVLSAWYGVSAQRTVWSSNERMQGVLDQAHWAALAVVLAWVLRTPREWRALFAGSVAASATMACLVVARALEFDVPFFSGAPEPYVPGRGGPIGNPASLAVYMLANCVLAAGFAARAWTPPPGAGGEDRRWLAAAGWAALAALDLAALALAGSVDGAVGLFAAIAFAAFAFAWLARGRRRLAAIAVLAALVAGGAVLAERFFDARRTATASPGVPAAELSNIARVMRHVTGVHVHRPSAQSRLPVRQAGLEGFAERPLLGWGPENLAAVFGRFAARCAATAEPHDKAHAKAVEVAATTGLAGLAIWLALCGLALAVPLRATRAMAPPERTLTVFAAAALAGHLVQIQFLCDVAAGNLVSTILIAFAARLETSALPRTWLPRLPAWSAAPLIARCGALPGRRAARAVLGAAASRSAPGDAAPTTTASRSCASGALTLRRSSAVSMGAGGKRDATRTVWFYRIECRMTGGTLKHSHYFDHVRRTPGFSPRIVFGTAPPNERDARERERLWPPAEDTPANRWVPGPHDVLFLAGLDWRYLERSGLKRLPNPRINLVQGMRHAWEGTEQYEYLSQPAVRICVSGEVADAIAATARTTGPVFTIPNGIDLRPFTQSMDGAPVGYGTRRLPVTIAGHKRGPLARRLSRRLREAGIEHRLLIDPVDRDAFLALLAASRVAVCLPLREEGFYLPALEGMAKGAIVVTLDCIGNRGFCRHGENCFIAEPKPASLLDETLRALALPVAQRVHMHRRARDTAAVHSLDAERTRFQAILGNIDRLWSMG